MRVDEHTTTIDDVPVFYRSGGAQADPLYLHDVPTSSDDWLPFLERIGGVAPDLIGFGRSGKGGHLDYSPEGLASFVTSFADELGPDRISVVGHGWGAAIALLLAVERPAQVARLVVIDAIPLLDGFTWPRLVRVLRTAVIGELVMGSITRSMLARALRSGASPLTDEQLSAVWERFDHGTQRAVLRLHRAAGEQRLAEVGRRLSEVEAPTLIIWGAEDGWLDPILADRYAATLGDARVERIDGAGHWPWLDRPEVVELVARFLAK